MDTNFPHSNGAHSHGRHSDGSRPVSEEAHRLDSPVEALINLVFLAKMEAESAERVRFYMELAEPQIEILQDMVRKSSRHSDS
jgi:hypothetical protein